MRIALIASLCALFSTAVHAQSAPDDLEARVLSAKAGPLLVAVQERFGVAAAPYVTRNFPRVHGHGFAGLLRASYALSNRYAVAPQVPLLAISVEQPAGSYVDQLTWGNPNLAILRRDALWQGKRMRLSLLSALTLALPIAERGPPASLLAARALRLASAFDADRHPELYTEGVLPLAASSGFLLQGESWALDTSVRVPLLVRVTRAHLPHDAQLHALGVHVVAHLGAAYQPVRWFNLALAADMAITALPAAEPTRAAAAAQFSLTPAFTFALPRRLFVRGDFVLPIAGPLGGNTYAGSLAMGHGF